MIVLVVVAVAACFTVGTNAQKFHLGKCPNVTTVPDFDVARYTGEWYEITKFNFVALEGERCLRANYTLKPNGHVGVLNWGIKADGSIDESTGDAVQDSDMKSKLVVTFADNPQANYWVVDTDYDNYSLVWSCADYTVISLELAWILSRKQTLDDGTVAKLKQNLASFGIDTSDFVVTDQTNCPTCK